MSEAVRRKTFMYGKDVAIRLPKEFGVRPGDKLELKRNARGFSVCIIADSANEPGTGGVNT